MGRNCLLLMPFPILIMVTDEIYTKRLFVSQYAYSAATLFSLAIFVEAAIGFWT